MKNKIIQITVVILAAVLIGAPLLTFLNVREDFISLAGVEYKTVSPKWSYRDYKNRSFQNQFNEHFGKSFFLRKTFLKIKNQLYDYMNFRMFHSGSSNAISSGKHGILYGTGDWYPYYANIQVTDFQKEHYFILLRDISKRIQGLGIDFLYVIAPDKASFYPEYRSEFHKFLFSIKRGSPNYEFSRLLKKYDIPFLDAHDFLKRQEPIWNHKMFPLCGIHWNALASSLVSQQIFEQINNGKDVEGKYRINHFSHVEKSPVEKYEDFDLFRLLNTFDSRASLQTSALVPVFKNRSFTPNSGGVLVIGDSFTGQIVQSLRDSKMFNQENIYHYGNIIPTQKELDGMLADLKLFCIVFTAASCFFPERNIVPLRKVLTSLPPESRIRYKKGFSHYESWGRWTAASQAELCISLPDELRGKTGKLRMKFFARVPSFSYSINNAPPQEIKCRQWQEECFIPYSKEQSQKQTLNITFRFKNLSSPKDNNESSDERKLGIGIQQISFGSK